MTTVLLVGECCRQRSNDELNSLYYRFVTTTKFESGACWTANQSNELIERGGLHGMGKMIRGARGSGESIVRG